MFSFLATVLIICKFSYMSNTLTLKAYLYKTVMKMTKNEAILQERTAKNVTQSFVKLTILSTRCNLGGLK